jgi:hypothetical protein
MACPFTTPSSQFLRPYIFAFFLDHSLGASRHLLMNVLHLDLLVSARSLCAEA